MRNRVEMYQNGTLVVAITCKDPIALRRELANYLFQYLQDGPVEVRLGTAP